MSFRQARDYLESRRIASVENCIGILDILRSMMKAITILDEFADKENRADYAALFRKEIADAGGLWNINNNRGYMSTKLEYMAMDLIGYMFPVNDFNLTEEFDSAWLLNIEPHGAWWSYDEFYECLNDPESFCNEEPILIFAKCLDAQVEPNYWPKLIEHFAWPNRIPKSAYESTLDFDLEKFHRLLKRRKIGEFADVLKVVFHDTGSIFLDICYDEGWEPVPLTNENIRELAKSWNNAQEYLKKIAEAQRMVDANPGLYMKILDAWDRCTVFEHHQEKPNQKTLAQIWTEEYERLRVRV